MRYHPLLGRNNRRKPRRLRQVPGLSKGLGASECFTKAGIFPAFYFLYIRYVPLFTNMEIFRIKGAESYVRACENSG